MLFLHPIGIEFDFNSLSGINWCNVLANGAGPELSILSSCFSLYHLEANFRYEWCYRESWEHFLSSWKKKVKTSKTEKRLVKMVSENNFCNSASKLMKQNLRVGVILDQNCIQILDATLNDLFFSKTCFIKSSLNMPRT